MRRNLVEVFALVRVNLPKLTGNFAVMRANGPTQLIEGVDGPRHDFSRG